MKKFNLLFILILSAFLAFSCSDNDDEELVNTGWEGPHQDDNGTDTLPEAVTDDEDKTDTTSTSDEDKTDTASEYDDSDNTVISDIDTSENGDDSDDSDDSDNTVISDNDTPENDDEDSTDDDTDSGDSDTDSGDSQPDDDVDTSSPEQPAFPECSSASTTPCKDSANKLIWSASNGKNAKWADAKTHCDDLTEGGFKDWHMPTISELRTLIQNCAKTATGGSCNVTDECLSSLSTANPRCYNIDLCTSTTNAIGIERCGDKTDGSYSKLGDGAVYLWSSSVPTNDQDNAWFIYFKNTNITTQPKNRTGMVRCVRRGE